MKQKITLADLREIGYNYIKNGYRVSRPEIRLSRKPDFVDRTLLRAEKLLERLERY